MGQSTKFEARNSKQYRSTKHETLSRFGFRYSNLFRISIFDIRISSLALPIAVLILIGSISTTHESNAQERASEVKEIFDLNKQIDAKADRLEEIQRKINQYRTTISREQGKAKTLRQRLAVLDDRIERQRLEIERVQTEREQVELEVSAAKLELDRAREAIARRQQLLRGLFTELRAADMQPRLYAVLASTSVGSYFVHRDRLTQLQDHLRRILADVRTEREQLDATTRALEERQRELVALNTEYVARQQEFEDEQNSKTVLLAQTKQSEQRYQSLVEELKGEVAAIDAEIVALESAVRSKLERIDEHFGSLGRVAFSWPVPNRGITTYFHDPEYPFRYIFEHPGLDIRAKQGSTIVAPAPGYVAKVKDAGYGYSYVMLVHPGGFSTVFGHVSCFTVQEGTYVDRGAPLACVGGAPGSRGAGRLTTGAHLHFEIRLNGIPVDPINYLL